MSEPLLSELVAELHHSGLLLNNLFQLDSGMWRASVRRLNDQRAFSFYDHPNPGAAVKGAIAQATYSRGAPLRENKPRAISQPSESGSALLSRLGLKK